MTDTMPLEVDLWGRVTNMRLAPSRALLALYEAVVNSIDAVLDDPNPVKGRVVINVLRGTGNLNTSGKTEPGPVIGFEIQDNGIGFDENNFASFKRSDSTKKAKYGGKGVGRLLWLKVFSIVEISSIFVEGGKTKKREFTFSKEGISKLALTDGAGVRGTTVTIKKPDERYKVALQHEPETIAISTIEHCLEYFIADRVPTILLNDADAGYKVELNKLFHDELKSEIKRSEFTINASKFRLTHLIVRGRRNSRHALHFCAHSRQVDDVPLSGKLPGLAGGLRLPETTEDLAYQGYVSGELLDRLVGVERSTFDFDGLLAGDPSTLGLGTVKYDALLDRAVECVKEFLEPTLKPILDANHIRVRSQIETTYPQYRYLLKHRADDVAAIPPGVEGKELDIELYKIEQGLDLESRAALHRELAKAKDPDEPPDARRERLDRLLEQLNDSGTSKLARHVVYRRAVIEFLEDQIGLQADGKYALEDAVHAAVCPTRTTSDQVSAAKMNLWLLDDRFYFHRYLASDMPISAMAEAVAQDNEDRPDLAIFKRPMAFSDSLDQIGAVVLVEFKRPARDNYQTGDSEKDPVTQVLKYVETLQDGKARRARGQTIHIRQGTPFYAYIVADLTPSLRRILSQRDFKQMPDGDGFFYFHQNANCYIEAISFQKMISDAKKRNQAFFDKLNMPFHTP